MFSPSARDLIIIDFESREVVAGEMCIKRDTFESEQALAMSLNPLTWTSLALKFLERLIQNRVKYCII